MKIRTPKLPLRLKKIIKNYTFPCHFHAYWMATFQKFSPSAKNLMVQKVTVRPPSGRWTSRSVDKGGYMTKMVTSMRWRQRQGDVNDKGGYIKAFPKIKITNMNHQSEPPRPYIKSVCTLCHKSNLKKIPQNQSIAELDGGTPHCIPGWCSRAWCRGAWWGNGECGPPMTFNGPLPPPPLFPLPLPRPL